MKYLIFLALVVQVLSGPAARREKRHIGFRPPFGPLGPNSSHPPPTGDSHIFDHYNKTGQPPQDNSSRPPHAEGGPHGPFEHHEIKGQSSHENSRPFYQEGFNGHPRHRRHIPGASGSPSAKNGNPPQDINRRGPPPSGRPPVEAESRKPGKKDHKNDRG